MISKSLYLNIIVRVLLILALSLSLGYSVFVSRSVRISIILILLIIIMTINLVSFLNTNNRKVRFFFDSVRNEDSSLSFPVGAGDSRFRELYNSMNRVNQQIQQLKIENSMQEHYFSILLEHIATGIISFNNKGFILHSNSSAKRMLSTDVLTHLQQIERIDQKLFNAINTIKPTEQRLVALNTRQGEKQLSLKATSFKTNDNELVILSIQDIKNELDEKELESWMKLIRVLMHEIMNSITPITSLSESLSNMYCADGQPVAPEKIDSKAVLTTLQGLNVIKEQGKGLMSFVEAYRKLTRVPDPQKELFKVEDLMTRIRILYSSLDKSDKVKLSFSINDTGLEIFADQNLISQVLLNLIKNAIEANEDNSNATIRIVSDVDKDNRPEICVIDNGHGISEKNLDEIFVPFFTTRPNGSGIGLSISRQIMRVHGGNLKVKSRPEEETIFCLSF
jgi:two-component system, NtrC family, nitrogen regulation sensor histidine kinase NtrY